MPDLTGEGGPDEMSAVRDGSVSVRAKKWNSKAGDSESERECDDEVSDVLGMSDDE
jgi:hypothetical protein